MDAELSLNSLLGDFSHLAARMRHIAVEPEISNQITGRGSYISLREGSPTVADFVSVFSHYLAAYALPRKQLLAASDAAGSDPTLQSVHMTRLREDAASLFIKARKGSHRSGEFGEIVLYILVEWWLQAPQVVSKMFLKTAYQMPVHGTDGIHARLEDDGKLTLIWGESKAHKSLESALTDALKSISDFIQKEEVDAEVRLVSGHLDLGVLDKETYDAVLDYLNPYSEASNNRVNRFAVLLMFNFGYGDEGECCDEELINRFTEKFEEFKISVEKKAGVDPFSKKGFDFFLLPVPCVQDIRDRFQKIIGMPAE